MCMFKIIIARVFVRMRVCLCMRDARVLVREDEHMRGYMGEGVCAACECACL